MNKIISLPHLGPYYIPIKYIIKSTTKCQVLIPNQNDKQTINLGSKYSPEEICMPFKYQLGNYLNALNNGANILIQAGGGCRYGYFAELQEQILKSLGYQFTFVNLIKNNHVSVFKMYKFAKKINKRLNIPKYFYYLINGFLMIIYMDKLNNYLRKNMGYEEIPDSFEKQEKQFYQEYSKDNLNLIQIIKIYYKYKKIYHQIKLKNISRTKVLLIGELFSLIDTNSSNNLERTLIKKQIEVIRYTDLTYLLLTKKFIHPYLLYKAKKYLKYSLGADGAVSVSHAIRHAKDNIDGIIHLKSFSCVPEINAIPILNEVSEDYQVPILYLSFDGQNNISNIDTKLEAFYDMIKARKQNLNKIKPPTNISKK